MGATRSTWHWRDWPWVLDSPPATKWSSRAGRGRVRRSYDRPASRRRIPSFHRAGPRRDRAASDRRCPPSLWALTGWVVNHELFATFSSQYGNENQVKSAMQRGGPLARAASADWVVIAARMFGMQPFVGIAAAGAVIYAAFMRKPTTLVPIVTFGPILAFAAWGQYTSTTFGWFRFYLLAIPLVVCVALACWTPTASRAPPVAFRNECQEIRRRATYAPRSWWGSRSRWRRSLNQRIGNQQLQFGVNSLLHPERFAAQDQRYRQRMFNDRVMADHLDRQSLADGTVLMDTFNDLGCLAQFHAPTTVRHHQRLRLHRRHSTGRGRSTSSICSSAIRPPATQTRSTSATRACGTTAPGSRDCCTR